MDNNDQSQADSQKVVASNVDLSFSPASLPPNEAFEKLLTSMRTYMPDEKFDIVRKAYEFASKRHGDQRRQSGDPYISHPISVASVLTELKLDVASITAAILHDVVEDTETTLQDIEKNFGKTVADLVDGLTKISKIEFRSSQEKLAENFRKMVLAMAKDLRVILIKLADRLHNMQTLDSLPQEKRDRIAQETLEIYAPLANRLGIFGLKSELEDLCLRYMKRDIYDDLRQKVASKKTIRQEFIDEVKSILEEELKKYGFTDGRVYGRPKHFYSIYRKMVDRHLDFEDIHDLFAFRIIVDNVKDCYEALGVVHSMWKPMPGKFKDYIAMPKANMYQSLHTTVIRPKGEPVEIQIRTLEMHEICEYGVAAHWAYKEKNATSPNQSDVKKFSWLRQIVQWQSELQDPGEFLEAVKVDLFQEEIFVFTPRGDVIQLAAGATALDFAFAVHTAVGLSTVGAKVNGHLVPLRKKVSSGDIVEILTSANQKPTKDWLNIVTTSKARNKIRSFLRSEQREKSRKIGREILEQELVNRELNLDKLLKSGWAEQATKLSREGNFDDLLTSIGYGKVDAKDLVGRAFPDKAEKKSLVEQASAQAAARQAQPPERKKSSVHGVLVSGLTDILVNFGRCCNPLPGEEIVGFITRGRGVTIHRATCSRALDTDPHRRVAVTWTDDSEMGNYSAFISVIAHDKPGVLAEITQAISTCEVNIKRANVHVSSDMMGVLEFELGLQSLKQLQSVIRKVEGLSAVVSAERKGITKAN